MKLRKQNRIRSRTVRKKQKFWCGSCDRAFIESLNNKCRNCGARTSNRKKIFKQNESIE